MTRDQAHALLDAAKAGCETSPRAIRAALKATGDLGQTHASHAKRDRERQLQREYDDARKAA